MSPQEEIMNIFQQTFHWGSSPKRTCMVCKIKSEKYEQCWTDKEEDSKRAEKCFLEDMQEQNIRETKVGIKRYINWTPCSACAIALRRWVMECSDDTHLEIICVGFDNIRRWSCDSRLHSTTHVGANLNELRTGGPS